MLEGALERAPASFSYAFHFGVTIFPPTDGWTCWQVVSDFPSST